MNEIKTYAREIYDGAILAYCGVAFLYFGMWINDEATIVFQLLVGYGFILIATMFVTVGGFRLCALLYTIRERRN
jgi:hypothetical protein